MFDRICTQLSLGELTAPPLRLSGGYTHRMFRMTTTQGDYAVKLLNPEIMQRPDAMGNYRTAEGFEALLEAENLPILPAKVIGGQKMQYVDGQYLYVFDYFVGRVLKDEEITPAHCVKMGAVLARIHGTEPLSHPQEPAQSPDSDRAPGEKAFWHELAEVLISADDATTEGYALRTAAPMLTQLTTAAEAAHCCLPRLSALCHNDMDPKNVLWQGEDFRIIDLECLGYADPLQEMLDLAISWAGMPAQEARFKAFVQGYYTAGGAHPADAALLYDSRRNYLDWLAYNAKRALFDDPEERRVAREQVRLTLGKIEGDLANRDTILRWMEEILHG